MHEGGIKPHSFLVRKMFDNVIGRTKEKCVPSVQHSIALTSNVFTELANTIGKGVLYNIVSPSSHLKVSPLTSLRSQTTSDQLMTSS